MLEQILEKENLTKYLKALEYFMTETEKYFQNIHQEDTKIGKTIFNERG